jgi:zinc transport system substrate-binding protein
MVLQVICNNKSETRGGAEMIHKRSALAVCLAIIISLTAITVGTASTVQANPIRITVTFNAIKEFAQAVGGDRVEIVTIIPDGTEPHVFEPKAQDLVALSSAQIFVYNGLGMEAWVPDALAAADNQSLIAVDASTGADPIVNTDAGDIAAHGQYDPHLWLSLKGAQIETGNIRDALVQVDPGSAAYYEANCADFTAKLESLYEEYRAKFGTAKHNSFVTGHAAFGYLCRDFGLSQNSVEDVFAEGEPSAQQLAALVEYCRTNGVTTIFSEVMGNPDISATLASEVGAKVETIYTLESAEDGLGYLERMESNLSKIYGSLAN